MNRDKKESVVITITIEQEVVNRVDKMALKLKIKTNRLIKSFITNGIEEIKTLKKYGILKKALCVRNFLEQHGMVKKDKKDDEIKRQRSVSISVRISKEIDRELDNWVLELGKTKNKIIEDHINSGIDYIEALNSRGMVDITLGIISIEDTIEKILSEKNLIKNWKSRFREAKGIANEMFRIDVKAFSQSGRPITEDVKVC